MRRKPHLTFAKVKMQTKEPKKLRTDKGKHYFFVAFDVGGGELDDVNVKKSIGQRLVNRRRGEERVGNGRVWPDPGCCRF